MRLRHMCTFVSENLTVKGLNITMVLIWIILHLLCCNRGVGSGTANTTFDGPIFQRAYHWISSTP